MLKKAMLCGAMTLSLFVSGDVIAQGVKTAATGDMCSALALVTQPLGSAIGQRTIDSTIAARQRDAASSLAELRSLYADRERSRLETQKQWAEIFARVEPNPDEFDRKVDAQKLAAIMSAADDEYNAQVTALEGRAADNTNRADENTEWTPYDISRMTLSIAGIADPVGVTSVAASYLYPKCGTNDAERGTGTFCWKDSAVRGVGLIPKVCTDPAHPLAEGSLCYAKCPDGMQGIGPLCWTQKRIEHTRGIGVVPSACPASHPDLDAGGLCYKKCPAGMNGVGPVCWRAGKESYGRGAGYPSLSSCAAGEEKGILTCYPVCQEGYHGVGPVCWRNGALSQTRGVGIPPKGCDAAHPDFDAGGLCYAKCNPGYKGVGPVCWTESRVSQPRGAGRVPTGCPASHPDYNAGLCYRTCSNGGDGQGPVCWTGCKGRFKEACGAGCATDKLECGFATADMVTSPLEMVGSIVSLGTYSGPAMARKAAAKAAREAAQAGVVKAGEKGAKAGLEKAAARIARTEFDDVMTQLQKLAGHEEQFLAKLKTGAKKLADNAKGKAAWLKQKLPEYAEKINALITEKPKQLLVKGVENLAANDPALKGRITKYLAKLEKIHDKAHLDEVQSVQSLVYGCAKEGYAIDSTILGVQSAVSANRK